MQKKYLDLFYKLQAPFYDITRRLILFNHKEAVDALDIQTNDTVYDVACGTGKNIKYLKEKTQADHIIGLDYSKSLLGIAQRKFPDVKFIYADVTTYHFNPKADKIICSYSLSMIDEREKAIANMVHNLKPWGKIVILDFNPKRRYWILSKFMKRFLESCHINLDQTVYQELSKYFHEVAVQNFHDGYNTIWTASKTK